MKRNIAIVVFVTVLIATLLFVGSRIAQRKAATGRVIGQAPSGQMAGQTAPGFELESINGGKLDLKSLRGKAVVINFWATWCEPCKLEIPWLIDLQNKYGAQGLQIVGVAEDDATKEKIAAFAKEIGINYPVLIGTEDVATKYGNVESLPTTFYVGRDGRIVEHIAGLVGRAEIEDNIVKALSASTPGDSKKP